MEWLLCGLSFVAGVAWTLAMLDIFVWMPAQKRRMRQTLTVSDDSYAETRSEPCVRYDADGNPRTDLWV